MRPTNLPPEIADFFDRYREAFDRLDGDAVARLYATPSGILSGRTYVHWPDFASVRANMLTLCERYRSQGYRAARYEPAWAAPLGPDACVADLVWNLERAGGREPWRFHTAYNLVRADGDWRILLCTAYEERGLPASPSSGVPSLDRELRATGRPWSAVGERERGPSMHVRSFQRGDGEAVVSLWERCGLTRPWNDPRKDIGRKLRVQPELFLVGVADHQVVATAMAGYEGHRGWVNYLAVDPHAQGSGLGTQIMSEVEQRLLQLGCPKINVQIRASNSNAVAFYRKLGYAVDEVTSMGKRLERDG